MEGTNRLLSPGIAWRKQVMVGILIIGGCLQPVVTTRAQPPTKTTPAQIIFTTATPIDEDYRQQFLDCDQNNTFRGQEMEGFRRCSGDPNNLARLVGFQKTNGLPGNAVAFTTKLGVDYDGSWVAAHTPGMTDLKDTSKEYPGPDGRNVPTDSDAVPYVVIPNAGGADADIRNAFSRKTGVRLGDFGVVIFQDHVVPVVVADGGPFNKIGEGSVALHRALGREFCLNRNADGICIKLNPGPSSISAGVTTIVFTGSEIPGTTAATLPKVAHDEGLRLFGIFMQTYGGSP
jgi:Fungal chitosanase of glycosyl hydrolase group 75